MEFKGTKQKWIYTNHISKDITHQVNRIDTEAGTAICVVRTNNQKQAQANALLISKAPEMLELLKKHLEYHDCELEGLSSPSPDDWYNLYLETIQLVKEATEL